MKNEIVRSPETDRKLLRIPTTAEDLEGFVVASFETNTVQNFISSTDKIIDFEDLICDTHSAVTVGAGWKFTVPAAWPGLYWVKAQALLDFGSPAAARGVTIALLKNGVVYRGAVLRSSDGQSLTAMFDGLVLCDAGDYLQIQLKSIGGNADTTALQAVNFVDIWRLLDPRLVSGIVASGGGVDTSGGGSSDPGSRVRG